MPGRGRRTHGRGCWTPGNVFAMPVEGAEVNIAHLARGLYTQGGCVELGSGVTQLAGAVTHQQEGRTPGGLLHTWQGCCTRGEGYGTAGAGLAQPAEQEGCCKGGRSVALLAGVVAHLVGAVAQLEQDLHTRQGHCEGGK